jgi:hypothetical protein
LRRIPAIAALLAALALPGCLYSNVSSPLDTNLHDTVLGEKEGRSQSQSILWLVAWGDASSQAAAEEGGITTLRHMDQHSLFVFFGVYAQYTTIVYGD